MQRIKRSGLVLSLVLAAMLSGAVGAGAFQTLTTMTLARFGAYWTSTIAFDSTAGGQPAGAATVYLAADSLKVGDVVYYSASNKVAKSATLADYTAIAGVVIGGVRTSSRAAITAASVGTLAATANQRVLVVRQGRVWIPIDAADSVQAGEQVIPSNATAGAVEPRTTAIDSLNRIVGRAVLTKTASVTGLFEINIK